MSDQKEEAKRKAKKILEKILTSKGEYDITGDEDIKELNYLKNFLCRSLPDDYDITYEEMFPPNSAVVFGCVEDVIRSKHVSSEDKSRVIQCHQRIKMFFELHGVEPEWGNCDITMDGISHIYQIHPDKSVTFIKTIERNKYLKVTVE